MTHQPCIAIVEDDDDQRQNYVRALARMPVQVLAFADKQSALQALANQRPDLLILDIILGQEYDAGFNLYSQLSRQYPDLPVLFLTERVGEIDQVSGLRMGAWDYQPKPISIDYFVRNGCVGWNRNLEYVPSCNTCLWMYDCGESNEIYYWY